MGESKTILIADIVDGTRTFPDLTNEEAVAYEENCVALMREVVEETSGHVFRQVGDQIDCAYADPIQTVEGARRLRHTCLMARRDGRLPRPLRLRMGFEHGPVLREGREYRGTTVILATRLADMAKASEILTTGETRSLLPPELAHELRYLTERVFRGYRNRRMVYRIVPDRTEAEEPTMYSDVIRPERRPHTLELTHEDQSWTLGPEKHRLDIGRTHDCDVRIRGPLVSRLHARVFWQPTQIEFEDQSTNGSYVNMGSEWIDIHRARMVLSGTGRISLGPPHLDENRCMLHFACVPLTSKD